jgi:hypothetical protein
MALNSVESFMGRVDDLESTEKQPWNKLEKAFKLQKLNAFAETYGADHKLSDEQVLRLKEALKERLGVKQLMKMKDVAYDKVRGVVTKIDCLVVHKDGTFGFRNTDSVSPLLSLAPKTRKLRVDVVGSVGVDQTARAVVPNGAGTAAELSGAEGGKVDPADVDDRLAVGGD